MLDGLEGMFSNVSLNLMINKDLRQPYRDVSQAGLKRKTPLSAFNLLFLIFFDKKTQIS